MEMYLKSIVLQSHSAAGCALQVTNPGPVSAPQTPSAAIAGRGADA